MSGSSMLLLAALVLLLLLLVWKRRGSRGIPLPPGPPGLPLLGNLLQVDKHEPFKTFLKWSQRYGPVMTVHLGPRRFVVLSGYQTVKEALVDQGDDFTARAPVPVLNRIVRGYGLVVSNGERWTQLRRFTLSTLKDFGMGRKRMEQWIQEESRQLLDSLRETKGSPFEPSFFLSRAVSNVICALVFGERFNYDDANFLRLLQIISEALRFGSTPLGQLCNIFPRIMNYMPGRHQQFFTEIDKIREFVTEKIHQHRDTLDPDNPRDFIDCFLIKLNQEKDLPKTEFIYDNLVSTVLNLFFAGTETTSTTLRYTLMLLMKHPEIQDHIYKEIEAELGQERPPMMEDRKSLPFTDAVIHEAQRFLDVVPLNLPRYTTKDIPFKGYGIPKDTVVIPLLHSVLRDEKQWENAWTFNPDNFLDQNGNFKKNPAFFAFSAGKRSCVGESLARMELLLFLVSIVQKFHLSTPGGPYSLDTKPEFSSFANVPRRYQLIATPRC
ncbi:cytochrome P450 2A5-like [Engraulis encrasicolus]|uniref:cytochrome P450 2A5-like n=1 Tax=Engraulis encrasicolus TaxID=184585 RepID=UPI002FCEAA8B